MRISIIVLAILVCLSYGVLANEHPPHGIAPGKALAEEHPGEHQVLTAEQVIKGIKDHISSTTEANAGIFPVTDPVEGKDLRLKLIRIHEDKVSHIKKDDAYFACSDFITENGSAAYDLDFWMKDAGGGKLEVYDTKIHKKDGIPRFTYKDDEIVVVD